MKPLDQFKPQFLQYCIQASLGLGQYDEVEKRLRAAPFSHEETIWKLVHSKGPKFFVLREFLRRGNYVFTVCGEPLQLTSFGETVLLTARCIEDGFVTRVRGTILEADKMPLYIEAGDWDCPQINPLFDWTEAQAWGYLIHAGLIDEYHKELGGQH